MTTTYADPHTKVRVLLDLRTEYGLDFGDIDVFKTPVQDQDYWSVEGTAYRKDELVFVRGYVHPNGTLDVIALSDEDLDDPFAGLV